MSIVEYLISIKNQSDRICISLTTSKMAIEILNLYCSRLEMLEDDGEKILVISSPNMYLGIPESEIDEMLTYKMNQYNLFHQDINHKKMNDSEEKLDEDLSDI